MTDKSIGKNWGKLPKPIKQLRANKSTSFRTDYQEPYSEDCVVIDISDNTNLIPEKGRNWGDIILYEPEQLKNFPSQWSRYNNALETDPDRRGFLESGSPYWDFCRSQTGEGWRVELKCVVSYLSLNDNNINICADFTPSFPYSFYLDEYLILTTDAGDTCVKWEVDSGKATITDSNKINPQFVIDSESDLPVIIIVTAIDNETLVDGFSIECSGGSST